MSITTIGNRLSQEYFLGVLRGQLDDTQRQSASGKKSDSLAGLGALGASQSISYRVHNKLLDSYTTNLNAAKTRLDVVDKAIGSVTNSARDIATHLRTLLQDVSPRAVISAETAQTQLNSVVQKLNTQLDGRYLFAGDATSDAPLDNLAGLNASAAAQVTSLLGGPAVSADDVVAAARGKTGADLGLSASSITAGKVTFRADDATDIDFTQNAGQAGYADILRGLSLISNLKQPTTPAETANYWSVVNGAIKLLDTGADSVDNYQSQMGNQAATIDNLLVQHNESQATFDQYIGDVEDVDMAEVATKLQGLQTQMQTSFTLIAALRDLSLVKYL